MRRWFTTLRLSQPLLVTGLGAGALLACTYDFDRFESVSEDGATAAGATAGRGGSSVRGGSTSGAGFSGAGGFGAGSRNAEGGTLDDGPTDGGDAGTDGVTRAGAAGASSGFDCQAVQGTTSGTHCYFLVGDDAGLSWAAARTACERQDAHLVTITSSDEQNVIEHAFFPAEDDVWLGLSLADRATQPPPKSCSSSTCPFGWVSGEAVSYTNWDRHLVSDDEPNYTGPCVRSLNQDGKWADLDCATVLPALCERD